MTSELAYDGNSNPIQIASESIPGSGDPNLLVQMGYSTYGDPNDPNDRWFVDPNQQTDAGHVTLLL